MGKVKNLIASLLLCGSVSASSEDSDLLNLERTSNAKTINELVIEKDKGEKSVEENELTKITTVRFLYENKGYVLTLVDVKEENEQNGHDCLTIKTYSISASKNVGRYVGIVDENISGKVKIGFEMYYVAKPDENVLPEKESDRPLIEGSRIIQTKNYSGEKNDRIDGEAFQAEYDDLMLEIMDFYSD